METDSHRLRDRDLPGRLAADHPALDRLAFEGFLMPLVFGFALVVHVRGFQITYSPAPGPPIRVKATPPERSTLAENPI